MSIDKIDKIIAHYNAVIKGVDSDAAKREDRAYGGVIRAEKGKLQEFITEEIIRIAWSEISDDETRLEINSNKIPVPIQESYIKNFPDEEVKKYIKEHKNNYYYGLSVDKHVFIDDIFVMGIECKAYTENAMLKRILTDFHLLKTLYPNISCHLFQLESQLGGDYSDLPDTVYGSKSTHTIMSYFDDVDLHITTLLKGERDIKNPIHKKFKPLEKKILKKAVEFIKTSLISYV